MKYSDFVCKEETWILSAFVGVMALEGGHKEHHGYSIAIYLQEQRIVS